ncbi:MAG: hypothetical protein R2711_16250 [Acidimicrobiales bacterium]
MMTTDSPATRPEVTWVIVPSTRPSSTVRVSVPSPVATSTVEVPSAVVIARVGTERASASCA